jgi:hypothetical protein
LRCRLYGALSFSRFGIADPKYIVLIAFDLLHFNGYDLRTLPSVRAQGLLNKIIAHTDVQQRELLGGWQGDVQARLQDPPRRHHLQGPAQPLHLGRANDWAKKSCA